MSGHTPGPWRVDPRYLQDVQTEDGSNEIASVDAEVLTGGVCPESREERRANARLIAAAPELLVALQDVVHWRDLVDSGDDALDDRYADMHLDSALISARAAIAKATGAQA